MTDVLKGAQGLKSNDGSNSNVPTNVFFSHFSATSDMHDSDKSGEMSLESRLQYFLRTQATDDTYSSVGQDHALTNNLGVGQILPSLLSPSGKCLFL